MKRSNDRNKQTLVNPLTGDPMTAESTMRKVFVKFPSRYGELREGLWGRKVTEDTFLIDNIPFSTEEVGRDDLVRVSRSGEVLEVLQRATRTRHARFEPVKQPKKAREQWHVIEAHLAARNVECEAAWPGVFSRSEEH